MKVQVVVGIREDGHLVAYEDISGTSSVMFLYRLGQKIRADINSEGKKPAAFDVAILLYRFEQSIHEVITEVEYEERDWNDDQLRILKRTSEVVPSENKPEKETDPRTWFITVEHEYEDRRGKSRL